MVTSTSFGCPMLQAHEHHLMLSNNRCHQWSTNNNNSLDNIILREHDGTLTWYVAVGGAYAVHPQTGVGAAVHTPCGRAEADDVEETGKGQRDKDAACQPSEADRVYRHARCTRSRGRHNGHRRLVVMLASAANGTHIRVMGQSMFVAVQFTP